MARYKVTIAQTWSESVIVNAKTSQEAKREGWKKHKAVKKNYEITTEKE